MLGAQKFLTLILNSSVQIRLKKEMALFPFTIKETEIKRDIFVWAELFSHNFSHNFF